MRIEGRVISSKNKPYIIAELSANHNGSLERAKKSILEAKKAGADAVKIQTYTADTMTIKSDKKDFLIEGGPWNGYQLYDLYQEAHTPYEWHAELFNYAKDIGITIFSSPFDETAVDLLEKLGTPAYKIASFELCDLPLIEYIAKTKKPVLMSTGMANLDEIEEALNILLNNGCNNILLFHCISSYPAPLEQANLKNIQFLAKNYSIEVGLSDHTIGNTAAIAAIALGASAIEKHFTLSRQDIGPDSEFSIEPEELKELIKVTSMTHLSLGNDDFQRASSESKSKVFRRSLYFVNNLKKGDKVKPEDVRRIRPGYGLKPKFINEIIGRELSVDIEKGDRVDWDLFCK